MKRTSNSRSGSQKHYLSERSQTQRRRIVLFYLYGFLEQGQKTDPWLPGAVIGRRELITKKPGEFAGRAGVLMEMFSMLLIGAVNTTVYFGKTYGTVHIG